MSQSESGKRYVLSVVGLLLAGVLNYGISLVLTPYITNRLGAEAYGFVSMSFSFSNYVSIITVAINAMATRFIAVEYHKQDYEKANQYFSTLFIANVIMSAALLVLAGAFILRLELFFRIPAELLTDVKLLFLFSLMNVCVLSLGTVYYSATLIRNRLDLSSLFKMLGYATEAVMLVLLFSILTPHVQYVGLAIVIASTAAILVNWIYSRATLPELRVKRADFRGSIVRDVFSKSIWYSFNTLGNTLNSGVDLWITNLLLSTLQMGQLGIVKTVLVIFTAVFMLTAQPFQPILLKNYAAGDRKAVVSNLKFAVTVNGLLSNILFAFLVVFSLNYYRVWIPKEDANLLQHITTISVIGMMIEGTITPMFYVYVLTLKNKIPSIVTFISGLLNAVSMYVLIRFAGLGLDVVVCTTAVLSWLVYFFFTPSYTARCLNAPLTVFYPAILRNILSAAAMVLAFFGLRTFLNPASWMELILTGLVCAVIGGVIHLVIAFSREDRKTVLGIAGKLLKRGGH